MPPKQIPGLTAPTTPAGTTVPPMLPPVQQQPMGPFLPGAPAGPGITAPPGPVMPQDYQYPWSGPQVSADQNSQPLGWLNLFDLASQAQAETDTRVAGQRDAVAAFLQDLVTRQTGENSAEAEASQRGIDSGAAENERQRQHQAALAATARAFEERQAALNAAINRGRGGGGGGGSRDPEDPYALAAFKTDEEIRQAAAIMALEAQYGPQPEMDPASLEAMTAGIGANEANAYRGDLLRRDGQRRTSVRQSQGPQWQQTLQGLAQHIADNGGDPFSATQFFRNRGYGRSADERASLGLADLGYYLR